ncbi:MAG: PBECR2 nuclease fold domain-containing protein [Oscillospiraceae bacterium]|nr:PBECR2 nuclease fold domain-containing protein [Oscillospiraceae bacterium]
MLVVGKIDVAMFQAFATNIKTDEVILTETQAKHVQEKHPEAYQRYLGCLTDILQSPDYILRDPKHEDTALVIKRYQHNAEVILRLCTDDSGRKNSIITFWQIKEARLQRYLLTHEVLYENT